MEKESALIFVFFALLFLGCKQDDNNGKFAEAPFPFELPEGTVEGEDVHFGYVTVPEFHDRPRGNTMDIAVALFHSYSETPSSEPLVLLSGGPGESNIATFTGLLCGDFGKMMRDKREVILVEIRGTYYSKPKLICPEIFECEKEMPKLDLSVQETMDFMLAAVEKAHDRLQSEGVNLAAFNNSEIADDVDMVMKTLGYEKYHVFGFSAGTITVQNLLKKHSESLQSATMTGVVSLRENLAASNANIIALLEKIFELCETEEKYKEAFPDIENRFLHMLDSLNAHPVKVERAGADGEKFDYKITGDGIVRWLAFGMYFNNQLPLTINKLLNGDYTEMISTISIASPQKTFSHGLSFSIMASEFIPKDSDQFPYNKEYETVYNGLKTAWFSPQFNKKMAKVWGVAPIEVNLDPIVNDVPTLMLCGEYDHACPPRYAEEIADGMSNAYVYLFKGMAHTQVALTPCLAMMLHAFVTDPSKAPDVSCVEAITQEFVLQ